jgi:recombination protein RecA
MQVQIFADLEKLNIKLSQVEEEIGCPKNYLSRFKNPDNILPQKWVKPLQDFLWKRTIIVPSEKEKQEAIETPVMAIKSNGTLSLAPSPEKLERLQQTLDSINKDFGVGSIMRLGDAPIKGIEAISTGILPLNVALGIGGLPKGRIVEIYGGESSAKTTISIMAMAEAQKRNGKCAIIDTEQAFDPSYAQILGLNISDLYMSQPDYAEQALEELDRLILSGSYAIIVLDSVAALVPKAELEGEMGDSRIGVIARLMSQAMRKITASINKSNTLVIFINQTRAIIPQGYTYPGMPTETTTGGNALKFYSSVRIETKRSAQIKDGDEVIGNKIRAKIVKSKVSAPFKIAEFDIMYGEGVDKVGYIIDLAIEKNIIKKSGSWFSYGENKLGQGRETVRQLLKDNQELYNEIESKV